MHDLVGVVDEDKAVGSHRACGKGDFVVSERVQELGIVVAVDKVPIEVLTSDVVVPRVDPGPNRVWVDRRLHDPHASYRIGGPRGVELSEPLVILAVAFRAESLQSRQHLVPRQTI
ncbi:Protein of unknown function [Propionibacterium freudenreichii subsp. freudenreichii]|uniref:Uncharacterized protein n=1 Tax=Propionibacterium freudenreichii subsp. freudenreichii TaxID=66712 RepID=A0A0B7NTN6_PROFF|nr:Protein of unknown function [Propionibacterium freudenreichii subsp. freudenreichii]